MESMPAYLAVLGILIQVYVASVNSAQQTNTVDSAATLSYETIADRVDHIPRGLKARFSKLKGPAIARYKGYLRHKSMPSHSDELCKEGGLICDDNIDSALVPGLSNVLYWKYKGRRNIGNSLLTPTEPIGFLREKQLHKGAKIVLQDLRSPTLRRSFLPASLISQFPFSSDRLPELLSMLNINRSSVMADRMAFTLDECEESNVDSHDEIKFCATSSEELFRLVSDAILGDNNNNNSKKAGVLETSSCDGSHETVELMDVHLRASTKQKVIACHDMPFPYTVFYCHKIGNTKVYETSWVASNGKTVRAVALCHMDTSDFDPSHPAFAELHTKPGESEICHWMSEFNLVWFSKRL